MIFRCKQTSKGKRCHRPFWHRLFGPRQHFYGRVLKKPKAAA